MLQHWRILPAPGATATLPVSPSVSLRPSGPVMLRVEPR
jgi:hypothetical protein